MLIRVIETSTHAVNDMTQLKINDLQNKTALEEKALAAIYGGINTGFILPYQDKKRRQPTMVPTIIGSIEVTNNFLINPVFNLINKTVNQNQFVNVDTSNIADSIVNVLIGQDQAGSNI